MLYVYLCFDWFNAQRNHFIQLDEIYFVLEILASKTFVRHCQMDLFWVLYLRFNGQPILQIWSINKYITCVHKFTTHMRTREHTNIPHGKSIYSIKSYFDVEYADWKAIEKEEWKGFSFIFQQIY